MGIRSCSESRCLAAIVPRQLLPRSSWLQVCSFCFMGCEGQSFYMIDWRHPMDVGSRAHLEYWLIWKPGAWEQKPGLGTSRVLLASPVVLLVPIRWNRSIITSLNPKLIDSKNRIHGLPIWQITPNAVSTLNLYLFELNIRLCKCMRVGDGELGKSHKHASRNSPASSHPHQDVPTYRV